VQSIAKKKNGWQLVPGEYTFMVGGSSQDLPLHQSATHQ
jgi:beta-glucosidase